MIINAESRRNLPEGWTRSLPGGLLLAVHKVFGRLTQYHQDDWEMMRSYIAKVAKECGYLGAYQGFDIVIHSLDEYNAWGASERGGTMLSLDPKVTSFCQRAIQHIFAHELAHFKAFANGSTNKGSEAEKEVYVTMQKWGFDFRLPDAVTLAREKDPDCKITDQLLDGLLDQMSPRAE